MRATVTDVVFLDGRESQGADGPRGRRLHAGASRRGDIDQRWDGESIRTGYGLRGGRLRWVGVAWLTPIGLLALTTGTGVALPGVSLTTDYGAFLRGLGFPEAQVESSLPALEGVPIPQPVSSTTGTWRPTGSRPRHRSNRGSGARLDGWRSVDSLLSAGGIPGYGERGRPFIVRNGETMLVVTRCLNSARSSVGTASPRSSP